MKSILFLVFVSMVRHFLLKAEKYFNPWPKGQKEGKKKKFSYETDRPKHTEAA